MKNFIFAGFLSLVCITSASAQVIAMPSYQDLGRVLAPSQRSTTVSFMNTTGMPISIFSTYCTGDTTEFNCNSSCFSLSAYGSCTVWISFNPRVSDGMTKTVTVQAFGSGVFTQAQVSAVDEKPSGSL